MIIFKRIQLLVLVLLLAPVCLIGMDATLDNVWAPLQASTNKPHSDTMIRSAFNEFFSRVCGVVVASYNLYETKLWLEGTEFRAQIDEHVHLIKEHINKTYYENYQLSHQNLCQYNEAVDLLYCYNFQVLDGAQKFLHRKVTTLASMVKMVILSGQCPEYFGDCQKLKNTVERRIMLEDIATNAKYALGAAVVGAAFYCYSQVF